MRGKTIMGIGKYLAMILLPISSLISLEKLPHEYYTTYGNHDAPYKIVEYFTFQCPHCIKLFKSDFNLIKTKLIDTGKVQLTFHPVPLDLITIQAMICLSKLDDSQKKIFLEEILEFANPSDPELMAKLMITAMKVFGKPLPQIDSPEYIQEQKAFEDAFQFVKQEKMISKVPQMEINEKMCPDDIPSYHSIQSSIEGL